MQECIYEFGFKAIAPVGHAERTTESVLAHDHDEVSLVKQPFELDVLYFKRLKRECGTH